jgi:hypothetical protein
MAKHDPKPAKPVQVIHGALRDGGFAPILLVREGKVTDLRVRVEEAG